MPADTASRSNPAPLDEVARHCVIPSDIAFTRYYELVAPELPGMGITLDRWQQDIWELALGIRADGTLCCDVMGVTLSIARQAGKTWGIMVGLIAICIARPGTTVVWSSHHDRTSSETLAKIAGIVDKPAVRPKMRAQYPVVFTDDNRGVHFANGSRILFGARSSGFGRGFSEVDIQVYDECQNLKEAALTDMLAAMNVSDIGLAFFMGTPPRPKETLAGVDDAFRRRRDRALKPKGKRPFKGVYVELAAEKTAPIDVEADEFWEQLAAANPSFGFRVGRSAIERLVENMSPEDVLREVMGIWNETEATATVIVDDDWKATAVKASPVDGIRSLGIKFAADGSRVAVSGALKVDESPIHVELIGDHSGSMSAGTAQLVAWISDRWRNYAQVVIDGKSHAGALVNALVEAGVSKKVIVTPTWQEVSTANAMFASSVTDRTMTHLDSEGQEMFDISVKGSSKKSRSDGSWGWAFPSDPGSELPVAAASLALWAAKTSKRVPGRKQTVSY